jgi:hypothetical protein
MRGLINKAIQSYLIDTFGQGTWIAVTQQAQLGFDRFEAVLRYDAALTENVVQAASVVLNRPLSAILEDMGTYLVSHPRNERLRRLLRFGGTDFLDFLQSIDDLPDRARLAIPHLHMPILKVDELSAEHFVVSCDTPMSGGGHILVGLLRAIADDYGALVMLDHRGGDQNCEIIEIRLLDQSFAKGRRFDLAMPSVA